MDNGDYAEIDEIQQDETNHEDYEYPTTMDSPQQPMRSRADSQRVQLNGKASRQQPMRPRAASQQLNGKTDNANLLDTFPPQNAAASEPATEDQSGFDDELVGYAKAYELLEHDQREPLIPESLSSASDSSLSDSEVFKEIRQQFPSHHDPDAVNDDKLFISGNLENSTPPLSFKSSIRQRSGAVSEGSAIPEEDEEGGKENGAGPGEGLLEEQGIYQGLVMTDEQRRQLGIMPESIYMTTNLEQWLVNIAANKPHPSATMHERPIPAPVKPSKQRASTDQRLHQIPRSVKPYYRDYAVRAPPLPPVASNATRAERKAHAVVDQLLRSEASYLTSLNIAIEVYMKPLRELAQCSTPILDKEQVQLLFGSIADIAHHHELFYSALLSRTLDWNAQQKIGDIFMSSMHNKALMKHYTSYVNNFTLAMNIFQKSIQKKPRFVDFLKQKYKSSKTSLSLQGLMLKPIQRFPQYILFLTDLLKYTSHNHPDRITLQMALANLEGITGYLNEAKRLREQREVVNNLSSAVTRLPFRLSDSRQRLLHRQDVVTRLLVKAGGGVGTKHRCLLLFNNMVICAAAKKKKKSHKQELESTTGSCEFKGTVDTSYACKWFAPLSQVHIEEPDYHTDVWDKALVGSSGEFENDDCLQSYQQLKMRYKAAGKDFEILTRIANLVFTLSDEYQGLTKEGVTNHIRILQRKIARLKEQINSCQPGRIDLSIPSRDGSKRVNHTYRFASERIKDDWINAVRYAKLRLAPHNRSAWVSGEDVEEDEEIFSLTHKLPLIVETSRLSMMDVSSSVTCAAKVGQNTAWLAGGNNQIAQVTIIECVTPKPLVLECFKVDSSRILDILYVPPAAATQNEATLTATVRRISLRSTLQDAGSLTSIPPHMATVWLGAQCGKLSVYSAESMGDGEKKCLATVKFKDAITSLCYYHDQVYLSTAEGNVHVFRRSGIGWDLVNQRVVEVTSKEDIAIRCSCRVMNKLWLGTGGSCHILNLQTHKIELSITMTKRENAAVSHMVCWGEGVWVSYRTISTIELWHTVSKTSLQDINIKDAIVGILNVNHLEPKVKVTTFLHVTALMASSGYLWIGTSIGVILIYRIPYLEGIPIVSGKPYLAMDGHKGSVRVLLPVKTMATISSSRVSQFLSDEQTRRTSIVSLVDEEEESEGQNKPAEYNIDLGSEKQTNGEDVVNGDGTLKHVADPDKSDVQEEGVERKELDETLNSSVLLVSPPDSKSNGNATPPQTVDDHADQSPEEKEDKPVQQVEEVKPDTEQVGENRSNEADGGIEEKSVVQESDETSKEEANGSIEVQQVEIEEDKKEASYEFGDSDDAEELLRVIRQNEDQQGLIDGGADESGIYSIPVELDLIPWRQKQEPEREKDEGIYDIPVELLQPGYRRKPPANYEAPSTLHEKGPVTTRGGLFSPEFAKGVSPSSFTLPGRNMDAKQGAIFVLTAGRGLNNFRPGARTPVLFPRAATNSSSSTETGDDEGCLISYEVELSI